VDASPTSRVRLAATATGRHRTPSPPNISILQTSVDDPQIALACNAVTEIICKTGGYNRTLMPHLPAEQQSSQLQPNGATVRHRTPLLTHNQTTVSSLRSRRQTNLCDDKEAQSPSSLEGENDKRETDSLVILSSMRYGISPGIWNGIAFQLETRKVGA